MATSIRINDELMRKLKQKSNESGLKISELVENYLSTGLNNATSEDVSSFIDFDSMSQENSLESIIGIAQTDYTDDIVQLKKDNHRF